MMQGKGTLATLGGFLILAALAAAITVSLSASPSAANGQAQTEPTPTPLPELDRVENAELMTQMKHYCREAQTYALDAFVAEADDGQTKTVYLDWRANLYHWSFDFPRHKEIAAHYRIQRKGPHGGAWNTVGTVTDEYSWNDTAATGRWQYRVGLVELSVASADLSFECVTNWSTEEVNVPTAEQELERHCGSTAAYGVAATIQQLSGQTSDQVTLSWRNYGKILLPEGTSVLYRVERIRGGSTAGVETWEWVAEISDTETWSGPSAAGSWRYRVAVVELHVGDVTLECEPYWSDVAVTIPTAQEREQEAADRSVLIDQVKDCSTHSLTTNLNPEVREIVERIISERIEAVVASHESQAELVTMVVLLCSETESDPDSGLSGAALVLFTLFGQDAFQRY